MAALILLGLSCPALAAHRVAAGAQLGTQGVGGHLAAKLSERLQLRLTGSRWSLDATLSSDAVDYDAHARLGGALAILDWYPSAGSFRLSLGAGWNGNEVSVSAPLLDLVRAELPDLPPIEIDLGTASGEARGRSLAPVLLLGWGNPFRGRAVTVSLDLGVLVQGEPDVTLRADTTLPIGQVPGGQAALAALLASQERQLEAELDGATLLPLVVLSVSVCF